MIRFGTDDPNCEFWAEFGTERIEGDIETCVAWLEQKMMDTLKGDANGMG